MSAGALIGAAWSGGLGLGIGALFGFFLAFGTGSTAMGPMSLESLHMRPSFTVETWALLLEWVYLRA
eukprot:1772733-Amphidinium_carterae.1